MSGLETESKGSGEEVVLMDGSSAFLRRAQPEDIRLIEDFLNAVSEESLSFRFFDSVCDRKILLRQLIPTPNNYVLIALREDRVIGHTAYYRSTGETAEIGMMVLDAYQRRGLGTIMLEEIARAANEDGISVFETIISKENTKMIRMVKDMGFPTSVKMEPDMIRIRFPTSIDPITIEAFEAGEIDFRNHS